MGRKPDLSYAEEAVIVALTKENKSQRYITQYLSRCKTAVQQCFLRQKSTKSCKSRGRPVAVTKSSMRLLIRTASKEKWRAFELRNKLNLNVSVRTVQRYLSSSNYLVYRPMMKAPFLTDDHKRKRLQWAKEYVTVDARFWKKSLFYG